MKKLYIVMLFCMIQSNLFAQFRIKVLDEQTREPVSFAGVYYPDSKTGTIADADGVFTIHTQKNSLLVQITSIGYQTRLETVKLSAPELTIYMKPSIHELQEIVVSDNSSKLQGENVLNVEKLYLTGNTDIQGISLAGKLSSVAGISNFSTGTGIGKPVIRGLSGNRVAVFSQGIRVENQQWGDEHGLGLDENGYDQVEIIKGPASLLYGSDALGGVLYFSDERYAKDNSMDAALTSEFNSNTNGWRNTGAFKLSRERFHWNMFGGYTTHEDYKDGNNNYVGNSRFRTGDFKTSLGYSGDKFITALKYNFLNEQYGLSEPEGVGDTRSGSRKPELPYQDLTTHLISLENTIFFNNESKLKLDVGYIFNNRKEFEEHEHDADGHEDDTPAHGTDAALNMNLSTASYNARWYSPQAGERWTFIAGSQGMYQKNTNRGEETLIPNAHTTDVGVFALSDYHYSKKSYWQAGLRLDGRFIDGEGFSKNYAAVNFSIGVHHQLAEDFSLRANLSSGYRAPNMFELLSNGLHEGTNRYEIGNPDLKTENSYQIDASLEYKTEHLDLFVNPYFNYIRHYIYLQPSNEVKEELPVYYFAQTDAYLYGGEAGFHLHPHPLHWLHLEGSYSSTFGQDTDHRDLPLIPSQKLNATVRASLTGKKMIEKFSVYIHDQYSLAQNRVAEYETTTGSYNLVNAGLALECKVNKQKVLLNVAVNNIFDKAYYDHLSRYKADGIYNMGRNMTVRLSWLL